MAVLNNVCLVETEDSLYTFFFMIDSMLSMHARTFFSFFVKFWLSGSLAMDHWTEQCEYTYCYEGKLFKNNT